MPNVISRIPEVIDLQLYAGDGVGIKFTIKKNSDPFPFNGIVTSQIKAKRSDPQPLLTWDVDDAQFADGIVVISLSGEQTESLISNGKAFRGVWDLQYVETGAEPLTLIQGKVKCDADVTK